MGKNWSRKRWIKAALLTVGIADCVGIYYANSRLGQTVPDEVRYDRTAYTIPESSNMFHGAATPMFADAAPASAPVAAPPARASAPQLAQAEPRRAPLAHALGAAPAPQAAKLAVVEPAASKVEKPASRLAEGPRASTVSRMISAMAPAAKAAPASVVTPHLAKIEKPSGRFDASPAKLVSSKQTASLALGAQPTSAKVKPAAKAAKASTALAHLVPKARERATFATAFAGMDVPLQAGQQLELQLPTPALAANPVDTGLASAQNPVLETSLPAPAVELPPVSASADMPEAKL